MKYALLLALLGSASAIQINATPEIEAWSRTLTFDPKAKADASMTGNVSKLGQINPEAKKNATEVVGDQEAMEKEVVSAVVAQNNT